MGSATIHVSDAEFEKKVLQAPTAVIVDFWAPWCGPCRKVGPILDELGVEYEGKMVVAKVNTDENSKWAMQYGVTGIPTILFVRDGQVVDKIVGAYPKEIIKQRLEKVLGSAPALKPTTVI